MVEPKYYNTAGHPRIGSTTSAPENDLSPAAQEVLNAAEGSYGSSYSDLHCRPGPAAAAALRAAADQLVPPLQIEPQKDLESRREAMEWGMRQQTQLTRNQLLSIAAELRTHS